MLRVLIGVLLAGLALLAVQAMVAALRPFLRSRAGRRKLGRWALWGLGGGLVLALFLRFGWHWIVVAGSLLLAAARRLLPLLRFLPFLNRVRGGWRGGDGSSAGPDRPFGPGSGPADRADAPSRRAPMSRKEALSVLGLAPSASPADVEREYRRLMKRIHPDVGGSGYLAKKLNQAREVLLS